MSANLENSAVDTGLEEVGFQLNSKKDNAKKCSNYCIIAVIPPTSKVMSKFSKLGYNSM